MKRKMFKGTKVKESIKFSWWAWNYQFVKSWNNPQSSSIGRLSKNGYKENLNIERINVEWVIIGPENCEFIPKSMQVKTEEYNNGNSAGEENN